MLALIGDKWTMMVLGDLGEGRKRFNELRREITGISQKMLATKLRALERDGVIERTFYPVIPPRVDYELTQLGRELLASLESVTEFAIMHQFQVEQSRRRFDADIDAAPFPTATLPRRTAL
ncbi:MAG: helix-turn-helix domain-containing protein [Devosia sp.]|nr:helix-turn-helix domain-containing protein [Devosia sp.]